MERTSEQQALDILKELESISERQLHLMQERRIEEVLRLASHREERFSELKRLLAGGATSEVKKAAAVLVEKDRELRLNIEAELQSIRDKLLNIPTRIKAHKSYRRAQAYSPKG